MFLQKLNISRFILTGLLSALMLFSVATQAKAPSCGGLFGGQSRYKNFDKNLFDSAIEEFRRIENPHEIKISSPEKLLAFLEYYSSYSNRSMLGLNDFLENASWWQMKKLLWQTRKLNGENIITEKQLDKIVANVFKLTQFRSAPWSLLKNPKQGIQLLTAMPNQLIKNRFDQVLAKNGLATALVQMFCFHPSSAALPKSASLMKFSVFTLLTAIGVSGTAGLHPIKGLDPYMPEMDLLKDKMLVENLVGLANEKGYDLALEQLQLEFNSPAKRQSFFEIFRSIYNLSGRVLLATFLTVHGFNLGMDHFQTLEIRKNAIADVNALVPIAPFIKSHPDIPDPDRLGMALFNQYFLIRKSQNPKLDKFSPEMLEMRGQVDREVSRILGHPP